ncbi:sel1 repeat family protein [Aggregatibacter actinomycetemcomitans]|nr:sel1 repeat family protein [Aggregatibacter actinomycetemcomitans]
MRKFIFILLLCNSLPAFSNKLISIEGCDNLNIPFSALENCAKKGDYFTQYNLGVMYRDGINVPKDANKAFYWLNLAAQQGFDKAELNLGQLYELGIGVNQDPKLAFEWTYKSAMQGELTAVNNLGTYCLMGFGTQKNIKRAIELYQLAAENGSAEAQLNLGSLYFSGYGIPKDVNKALFWVTQSAKQEHDQGMALLGVFYRELGQYSESLQWSKKASEKGNALAQANLAYQYSFGEGVEVDKRNAESWLKKAIEKDEMSANVVIGSIYEVGNTVFSKDKNKALQFYLKAAEKGEGAAQNNVGRLLINNSNEDKLAISWFQKAAEKHVSEAMYSLYQIYSKGTKNIPQDSEKANYWLEKAKQNGFMPPQ